MQAGRLRRPPAPLLIPAATFSLGTQAVHLFGLRPPCQRLMWARPPVLWRIWPLTARLLMPQGKKQAQLRHRLELSNQRRPEQIPSTPPCILQAR